MANIQLKQFIEDGINAANGRAVRLDFLEKPLCEMQNRQFNPAERLILATMDRGFILSKVPAPPPDLEKFEIESNWPPLGDFTENPFDNVRPPDDCRDPAFPNPALVAGGGGAGEPSPADPLGPAMAAGVVLHQPQAAAGAGQAWGDPEPHIVHVMPPDGAVGQEVVVVGEGFLPEGRIYLIDKNGTELVMDRVTTAFDDYYAASFRRTYMRGKVPGGLTPGLCTIRVRNAKGGTVLDDTKHFVGYGPGFMLKP